MEQRRPPSSAGPWFDEDSFLENHPDEGVRFAANKFIYLSHFYDAEKHSSPNDLSAE
jgi:hypothetical protein